MAEKSRDADVSGKEQTQGAAKLRTFLVGLATDPAKLGQFIKDPDGSMQSGGLDAGDQAVLRSGNPAAIHARLSGQTITTSAPVTILVVDMTPSGVEGGPGAFSIRSAAQPQQTLSPQIFPQQIFPQQIFPQQIFPQQIFPQQIFPQLVFPQQVFPQLVFPQQVIHPQIVHPQIVHPQLVIHPQQVVHPQIVHPQLVIHPQQIVHPQIVHPQLVIHPQQVIQPLGTPGQFSSWGGRYG